MSNAAKRFEGMRANPSDDWRIEDVSAVCNANGIACVAPRRGDHFKVSHPSQAEILTIPAHRPIRPVYIRKLIAFIERVWEQTDDG
ncbi:MAG: type II toxin-antitoxin system HicA family toxin [Alphaproteobacteria bacterium]